MDEITTRRVINDYLVKMRLRYTTIKNWRGIIRHQSFNHLYPHFCVKCKNRLFFLELMFASKNESIFKSFVKEIHGFLKENYSRFEEEVRLNWSLIFAEREVYNYLKKLWKSPHVKFYCCTCYDVEEVRKKLPQGMLTHQQRILILHDYVMDTIRPVRTDAVDALLGGIRGFRATGVVHDDVEENES